MITKVVHGWQPAGLLAYLLGPGTAEVHRSPQVVASWDGLDARWQPERTGPGEYDLLRCTRRSGRPRWVAIRHADDHVHICT